MVGNTNKDSFELTDTDLDAVVGGDLQYVATDPSDGSQIWDDGVSEWRVSFDSNGNETWVQATGPV